jgi:hypothetical protein
MFFPLAGKAAFSSRSGFPTEKEMAAHLHRGMTEAEVRALFGAPGRTTSESRRSEELHYVAPLSYLVREEKGYIGFEVVLVGGRVQDWVILQGDPSFDPGGMRPDVPRGAWTVWLLIAGVAALIAIIRKVNRETGHEHAVLKAYRTRDIPTRVLPADFRFITHATTLQEVIDKAGPYSFLKRHPVSESFASATGASGAAANWEIVSFDYELPYAVVSVLTEDPAEPRSTIRAVCYRPMRAEDLT